MNTEEAIEAIKKELNNNLEQLNKEKEKENLFSILILDRDIYDSMVNSGILLRKMRSHDIRKIVEIYSAIKSHDTAQELYIKLKKDGEPETVKQHIVEKRSVLKKLIQEFTIQK